MAIEVFSNFVNTTLAGTIGPSATTFTVASGTGATLPQPAAGQFGRLIFTDQLTGNIHEIITYTSISGDTISGVTRGASPLTWSAGDIILCGPTAETMTELSQASQSQANSAAYAPDTGAANAYVIAPSPAIVGTPVAGTRLFFKAIAANTGASTLSVNGTSYPITGANGVMAANEIVANGNVEVVWNSTYSGFQLVSCTRAELAVPTATSSGHAISLGQANSLYSPLGSSSIVQGTYKNLVITATGSNAVVTITADQVATTTASNVPLILSSINITPSLAVSGANGLDTGTSAASTWYSIWIISNGTITAGLLSLSATSPTMPSGYTYKARIGWLRSDGTANKFPLGMTQRGRYATLLIGSANVLVPPLMSSGAVGTFTNVTYTPVAVAWANYAPSTAAKIRIGMSANNTAILIGVSSNPNRSGYATANPPELGFDSSAWPMITFADLQIETSNIYWAASGGTGYFMAGGWEDNL